jgi:hypothetical protein
MLPELACSLQVREFGLLPWAGSEDVLRSPICVVAIPPPPKIEIQSKELPEAERIFLLVKERNEARNRAERTEAAAAAQKSYRREAGDALGPLISRLRAIHQGRASCTDIQGLLRRLSMESPATLALVVTDAVQSCEVGGGADAPITATGAATVLVLVPPASLSRVGPSPSSRAAGVKATAPWVHVVPSFRVNPREWSWLPIEMPDFGASEDDSLAHIRDGR